MPAPFLPLRARAARPGPNDRIRVGAIGVGGRATLCCSNCPSCAVHRPERLQSAAGRSLQGQEGGDWPVYQDYRKLLDRKDIDAVIVATGEFQRVLPCIHACQAGKDVYAEKPLTLYVREGRALVNAVRRYDRVLQVGSQQRSMAMNRVACELVRSGGLGKVLEVRAVNYTGAEASPATPFPEEPVPDGPRLERVAEPGGLRDPSTAMDGLDAVARLSPAAK